MIALIKWPEEKKPDKKKARGNVLLDAVRDFLTEWDRPWETRSTHLVDKAVLRMRELAK